MKLIIGAIFFLFLALIVISPIIDALRKNRSTAKNVVNHNPFSTEFVYVIAFSKEEMDKRLSGRGEAVGIAYRYDKDRSLITLSIDGAERCYLLSVEDRTDEGTYLLRVTQQNGLTDRGYIPYLINPFFVKRLDAVPIAYQ